ncbi:GFA family protein [Sphingorhabdus sp.]|uniref:GFA family protein n=1 Tax=Sphingorhabdus sp. TaxID=1902408 RepID=UPI0032B86434
MKIDGTCHCGEIAWEAEIDPDKLLICHCTDCQILSGGPFRWGTLIPKEAFTLLRGSPKAYRKIAASGSPRLLSFCGTCGTPLYGSQFENATTYSLRLSSARQAGTLRPKMQMWSASAIDWLDAVCAMPKIEQPNPDLKTD